MPLDRADIERLIPHAGAMVLLDRVVHWDAALLTGETEAHLRPDNPLRRDGRLAAIAGVEIAAQAMAVHGGLVAGGAMRRGRLASLRDIRLHVDRLDTVIGPMTVVAELLSDGDAACVYGFRLLGGARPLIDGRAGVFFT